MEVLKRALSNIQRNLGQLNATHKLLIGSVMIVLLMTLFIVSQYTGKAATDAMLTGRPAQELAAAAAKLNELGFDAKVVGTSVLVPAGQGNRAFSALGEAGALPNEKAILFENILSRSNWMNSRQQNEQAYINALANELSARIADFKGIRSAQVFLDVPEPSGFGAQMRKPSASATVTTDTGTPMTQAMVDAIVGFIAGSRAGLTIDRVTVTDAANGRKRTATDEQDILPATYLEHAKVVESQTREKLQELLGYIPGVAVAVTAHVDVARSRAEVRTNMPEKQGTISMRSKETEKTMSSTQPSSGGEPGFGSNQTADINSGGGGSAAKQETNETTTEYVNHVGTRTETIIDPKGQATRVAVSVTVPQGYVVRLIKAAAAAAAPKDAAAAADDTKEVQPSDDEINQRFAIEKKRIIDSITPHVRAMTAQSLAGADEEELKKVASESIDVAMVPVDVPANLQVTQAGLFSGLSMGSSGSGAGGLTALLGGGLFDKAVLGMLSVAALFMMVMMVRKVGARKEMPTAEELVGLPPTLDAESDVVGEAEEGDTAMSGIEVEEGEMQVKKMLEQVEGIVEHDPEAAARLLNRWVEVQD